MAIGQARYPAVAQMFELLAEQVGALLAFDAGDLARQAGSPLAVNMVLLGALAATECLPFPAAGPPGGDSHPHQPQVFGANLKAFDLGEAAARQLRRLGSRLDGEHLRGLLRGYIW